MSRFPASTESDRLRKHEHGVRDHSDVAAVLDQQLDELVFPPPDRVLKHLLRASRAPGEVRPTEDGSLWRWLADGGCHVKEQHLKRLSSQLPLVRL